MVSVITLNYNQNNYTIKCVESILNSLNIKFHILLIDNGSTKENVEQLCKKLPKSENLTLKILENNIGYVGGINFGLKEGLKLNPDYFLIMNNDTIIDKHAVNELITTCQSFDNRAVVTGKVYHYDEPNKLQDIGSSLNKRTIQIKRIGLNEIDNGQYDKIAERDMLDDVFWLFSMKLYDQIGGYSPYFWFNAEQADFALRAKKKGYKLIYTPQAKLWHKGSVSIGGRDKNPRLVYWHTQSSLILRFLHLNRINFLNYFFSTINSVFRTSFKAIILSIKGDKTLLNYAIAKRKGFCYFLKWVIIRNVNIGENPFN